MARFSPSDATASNDPARPGKFRRENGQAKRDNDERWSRQDDQGQTKKDDRSYR